MPDIKIPQQSTADIANVQLASSFRYVERFVDKDDATWSVQVNGKKWNGRVEFQGSVDSKNWFPVLMTRSDGTAKTLYAQGEGLYIGNCAGLSKVS